MDVDVDAAWSDSMAAVYDRALGPALFAPYAVAVAERVAALRPRRLLELAAGTGLLTAELVARLPEADVVATDLNEAMVVYGAERVPGARWAVLDAQRLEGHDDASVDVVVCQFGVMFLPDRAGAYAEARRVLRPGGALVLAVWDGLAGSDFPRAAAGAVADLLPEQTPDFFARVPYGYGDPARITADLEAAGFAVDPLEHLVLQGHAASAAVLAEGFCLGTPLRAALAERGSLPELVQGLERGLRARLGDGPLTGDLGAWVVLARRPQE